MGLLRMGALVRRMRPARTQRGIAAIVAILVVALAASTSAYLLWTQSLATRHVENLTARAQADAIARAGAQLAGGILRDDKREVDHLGEPWAQVLPPFQAETAMLSGKLEDEQSRFNLNALLDPAGQKIDPSALAAFQKLLQNLRLPAELAATLIDWMDADGETTNPGGAEDLYYLALDPPYRTANVRLADVSELRRVKGFTDEAIRALAPFVTALPTARTINVNTAPAEVLEAVVPGVTAGIATQAVETRKTRPFLKKDDFKALLPQDQQAAADGVIDVKSDFFSAQASVQLGRVTVSYRAILDRSQQGWPRIIRMYGESL